MHKQFRLLRVENWCRILYETLHLPGIIKRCHEWYTSILHCTLQTISWSHDMHNQGYRVYMGAQYSMVHKLKYHALVLLLWTFSPYECCSYCIFKDLIHTFTCKGRTLDVARGTNIASYLSPPRSCVTNTFPTLINTSLLVWSICKSFLHPTRIYGMGGFEQKWTTSGIHLSTTFLTSWVDQWRSRWEWYRIGGRLEGVGGEFHFVLEYPIMRLGSSFHQFRCRLHGRRMQSGKPMIR